MKKKLKIFKEIWKKVGKNIPTREEINNFRNDLGDLREQIKEKLNLDTNPKRPVSDLMRRLWDLP